jgi:hypothetical protein
VRTWNSMTSYGALQPFSEGSPTDSDAVEAGTLALSGQLGHGRRPGRRLRDVSHLVSRAPFPADRDSACGLALSALSS